MDPRWRFFIPGYIWSLPVTLVGLLLMVLYRPKDIRIRNGLVQCVSRTAMIGRPNGQTFGPIQFYSDASMADYEPLRRHETTHTVQAFIFGPLFLVIYPAFFLWHFAGQGFKDWKSAYRKNPFEQQAERKRVVEGGWC